MGGSDNLSLCSVLSFPFLPFLEDALIDTLHTAEILMKEMLNHLHIHGHYAQNKLEGDVGDKVSLNAQTSPYFKLRETFKCIEHIDKRETQLKTSPEARKSEQNVSQFQMGVVGWSKGAG